MCCKVSREAQNLQSSFPSSKSKYGLDLMCNGVGLPALLLALCEKDISQEHSVECWILNLEAPGSIPAWGELYISTFPLFPVKFRAVTWN